MAAKVYMLTLNSEHQMSQLCVQLSGWVDGKSAVSNLKGQEQEEKSSPLTLRLATASAMPIPFQLSTHCPPLPALQGLCCYTCPVTLSAQKGVQLRQSCPETQGKSHCPTQFPSCPLLLDTVCLTLLESEL